MAWQVGVGFVNSFLDSVSKRNDLYATWSPKLREYAAECRISNPAPAAEELPARAQGKLPIFDLKIRNAERLPGLDKNLVLFCCLPLLAIPIAQDSWLGNDQRSAILTPEELGEWNKIYTHSEDDFWWFVHYWWDVEDPPISRSKWMHVAEELLELEVSTSHELAVPTGKEPWLVISGLQWGPLFGGETTELWSWNGQNAEFVETLGGLTFQDLTWHIGVASDPAHMRLYLAGSTQITSST